MYLLIWGEAANLRYMPECLAFLYFSLEMFSRYSDNQDPICEGYFLDNVISPLYSFLRDQNWYVNGNEMLKKEKDHADIVGYDGKPFVLLMTPFGSSRV